MPTTLLEIPPEVKLLVWRNLQAKDILRSRNVCNELKSFVNHHQIYLAKAVQDRETARLRSAVDHHDYSGLTIAKALGRWVTQKGLWTQFESCMVSAVGFADHYLTGRHACYLPQRASSIDIAIVVQRILRLHGRRHESSTSGCDHGSIIGTIQLLSDAFAGRATAMSASFIASTVQAAMREPHCLQQPAHSTDECAMEQIPVRLLSLLKIRPADRARNAGAPFIPDAVELLKLPQLPSSLVFAYYASEEWTERQILAARSDDAKLSCLARAAMMEEVFVY